jgi:hypothetical protein
MDGKPKACDDGFCFLRLYLNTSLRAKRGNPENGI